METLRHYLNELSKAQREIEGYAKRILQDIDDVDLDATSDEIWDALSILENNFDSLLRYSDDCKEMVVKVQDYVERCL